MSEHYWLAFGLSVFIGTVIGFLIGDFSIKARKILGLQKTINEKFDEHLCAFQVFAACTQRSLSDIEMILQIEKKYKSLVAAEVKIPEKPKRRPGRPPKKIEEKDP